MDKQEAMSLREQLAEMLIKSVHDIPFGFKYYKKKDALADADKILAAVAEKVEGMLKRENLHRYHEYTSNYGEDEYMRLDNARHIAYENGAEDERDYILKQLGRED